VIKFTVYAKPEPQGSSRAFVVNGRASVTSANRNLKPYRQELTNTAKVVLLDQNILAPYAGKHVPVRVEMAFYLERPVSIPKKRKRMVVLPDCDKLIRATADALKGLMFADDAQIVEIQASKHYGSPERVEITVQILE